MYQPPSPLQHLTVRLSKNEAKREALQRAVSRMFKADWVVMAGLWLDDENGVPEEMDEFGPEGDALWTRLLNGVALFEEMEDARKAVEDFKKDSTEYKDYLNDLNPDDGELDEAALEALNKKYEAVLQELNVLETALQAAEFKYDSNFPEE